MKTKWVNSKIDYDGSQLAGQYAYLQHQIMGPSAIAFRGACDVKIDHMADGEDLLAGEEIRGSDMLHFLLEVFDWSMTGAVALQRLLAAIVFEEVMTMAKNPQFRIKREGDDIFVGKGKLSISVAAKSPLGCVIHFAVNVSNKGTPVETACLKDLGISAELFGKKVLKRIQSEYASLIDATYKVRPVTTWEYKTARSSKRR